MQLDHERLVAVLGKKDINGWGLFQAGENRLKVLLELLLLFGKGEISNGSANQVAGAACSKQSDTFFVDKNDFSEVLEQQGIGNDIHQPPPTDRGIQELIGEYSLVVDHETSPKN